MTLTQCCHMTPPSFFFFVSSSSVRGALQGNVQKGNRECLTGGVAAVLLVALTVDVRPRPRPRRRPRMGRVLSALVRLTEISSGLFKRQHNK